MNGPVLVAVGTRPEGIKLAPVVLALRAAGVPTFLLSSGQHREMLDQTLEVFQLQPDADLEVMQPDQTLAGLSSRMLAAVDPWLERIRPSAVLVQGDTTTVAMVALAAFYRMIPVGHVEAGLRTGVRYDPFPEEMNRSLLGRLADWHYAPTPQAATNLRREGVVDEAIRMVGNTVVDALERVRLGIRERSFGELGLPDPGSRRLILVTAHRRENQGAGLERLCRALRTLAEQEGERSLILYPVHRSPRVRETVLEALAGLPNLVLADPLGYAAFLKALTSATLIITDSGGVQEEATALGIPFLVTRETSERPEALEAGVGELVGTDVGRIVGAARGLLDDPSLYAVRARAAGVFGDGRAAERIVQHLRGALAEAVAPG